MADVHCSGLCFSTVIIIMTLVRNASSSGLTYPFAFFNISTVNPDNGFIQVFACSVSTPPSNIFLRMKSSGLSQFHQTDTLYNVTENFNKITSSGPPQINAAIVRPFGLVLASDSETFVYGVKSDVGTADGFLVPPITKKSTEFLVAGWTVSGSLNYVGLIIVAALSDTCVEVFLVSQRGSVYTPYRSAYLPNAYSFVEITMGVNEDPSVLYVNSTRPVTVISGVSCGNVPTDTAYCDHMAEVMPPISELGTVHVVPPIAGRRAAAGYLIRVLASQVATTVTWTTVASVNTVGVAYPGVAYDISVADASVPIVVTCDKPCLVVQYNRGFLAATFETSYTDPFTMVITPVDHYVTGACYATASFCLAYNVRTDFINYMAISTTTANKLNIRFDGNVLPSGSWQNIQGYSVSVIPITAGYHVLTTVSGSAATFGGWIYGHSPSPNALSAYGHPIAYQMRGDPIDDLWKEAQQINEANTMQAAINTCRQPGVVDGSLLVADSSKRLYQYIQLNANFSQGVSINDACRTSYVDALRSLVVLAFNYINFQLCYQSMCPYLSGTGGVIASAGNFAAGVDPTELYVGINTANLVNYVTLANNNGIVTGVRITVPYVGHFNTTGETFGRCLDEIREFLVPFVNWIQLNNTGYSPITESSPASISQKQQLLLNNNQLITTPSSCPSMSFVSPRFFYTSPYFCS